MPSSSCSALTRRATRSMDTGTSRARQDGRHRAHARSRRRAVVRPVVRRRAGRRLRLWCAMAHSGASSTLKRIRRGDVAACARRSCTRCPRGASRTGAADDHDGGRPGRRGDRYLPIAGLRHRPADTGVGEARVRRSVRRRLGPHNPCSTQGDISLTQPSQQRATATEHTASRSTSTDTLDVLIVGAGFGGLYALHKLRGMGLKAHWCSRPHRVLAAPGGPTDIRVRASTSRAWSIRTRSPSRCSSSGIGANGMRRSQSCCATPTTLPIVSSCAATSGSTRGSRRRTSMRPRRCWRIGSDDGRRWSARFRRDGDRTAVDTQHAGVRRAAELRRPGVPFGRVAARAGGLQRRATSRWWAPDRRRCS